MDAFLKLVQYVQENGHAPSSPEEMKIVMGGEDTAKLTIHT